MRSVTLGLGLVAVSLFVGPANAETGEASQGGGSGDAARGDVIAADRAGASVEPKNDAKKKWEVGASWETHRLFRQEDLGGAGPNKLFNVIGATAAYDITPYDRVRASAYLYERFMVDAGETGFRFDDIILQYTRKIPLPERFTLRPGAWVTIPTSFASEKSSLITAPHVSLDLEKKFGEYVTANLRASGTAYIMKYRTAEGGGYNPKYSTRISAEVEVVMPFHKALSFGAGVGTGYSWYYEPSSATDQNASAAKYGSVADSQFSQQPISQSYSAEIYGRYTLPEIVGINADMLVAVANGDPSLGSQSVLHDGVGRFYFAHRTTAQMYAALTVRY